MKLTLDKYICFFLSDFHVSQFGHVLFKVLFLNLRETVGRITEDKERKVKGIQESKTEKCRESEK